VASIHMHIDSFDVQENWARAYFIQDWFQGIIKS
jgi:hypothetical protein